ncbi:hypothetical protein EJ06DRAFT_524795 [Trichodelitschia bisporula]|uniref:Uncharacterized protein n=1 Tax=Trichodelitschia bisporula TaxID=703511 RepID=A0A6G1HK44_9PEZI|nr:hypothetical protein EJ06DRAFT_524795 [Trichodelitschia bisporula]
MGARHNRKRTRSRPRNRNSQRIQALSVCPTPVPASIPAGAFHWQHLHQQLNAWPGRIPQVLQQQQQQLQHSPHTLQVQQHANHQPYMPLADRLRLFGGSASDEVSLCAPMLEVVMGLFNGQIDYEDP